LYTSHIDLKRDEKRNKYESILDENGISQKRTEKPCKYKIKPHRYENEWTKVKNGTGPNGNLSVRFQRYQP
jgi:hypothetical protein